MGDVGRADSHSRGQVERHPRGGEGGQGGSKGAKGRSRSQQQVAQFKVSQEGGAEES